MTSIFQKWPGVRDAVSREESENPVREATGVPIVPSTLPTGS